MGEIESRVTKLLLCQTWPFSWECLAFISGKIPLGSEEHPELDQVIRKLSRKDATIRHYISTHESGQVPAS